VKRRYIWWTGWALYAASFVMVAAPGFFGFVFAYWALTIPWRADTLGIFYNATPQRLAILVAGWMNPLFLAAAITEFHGRHKTVSAVLRILVVAMIPCCGVVSQYDGFHFREGFYAWILGMLLVLFSDNLASIRAQRPIHHPFNPPRSN